jgi:hypothetical protein
VRRLTWGVGASLGDLVQSILSTSATDAADSWNLVVSEDGINFLRPENKAIVGVGYILTHVDEQTARGLCRSKLEELIGSPAEASAGFDFDSPLAAASMPVHDAGM